MSWAKFRRHSKYHAKRVESDGHSFASKLEASVYHMLKLMERAGELKIEQVQDHVYLTDARVLYIPDFRVTNLKTGKSEWHEAKGWEMPDWKLKKKLWSVYGPGRLSIWKGTYVNPRIVEVVEPAA